MWNMKSTLLFVASLVAVILISISMASADEKTITPKEFGTAIAETPGKIVKFISNKKNEPKWLLEWRLAAYRKWLTMEEPNWASVRYPAIDYQDSYYYAAPKKAEKIESLDAVSYTHLRAHET